MTEFSDEQARECARRHIPEGVQILIGHPKAIAAIGRALLTLEAERDQLARQLELGRTEGASDSAEARLAEAVRARNALMLVIKAAAEQLKRHPQWDSHISGTWTLLNEVAAHPAQDATKEGA